MFEHYRQPLLSKPAFLKRMLRCVFISCALLVVTLALGTVLFRMVEHFSWIDGLFNAVLIMTGLGLENTVVTPAGKLLTSCYALVSAVVFYSILAILIAPFLHRMLHRLHLENGTKAR